MDNSVTGDLRPGLRLYSFRERAAVAVANSFLHTGVQAGDVSSTPPPTCRGRCHDTPTRDAFACVRTLTACCATFTRTQPVHARIHRTPHRAASSPSPCHCDPDCARHLDCCLDFVQHCRGESSSERTHETPDDSQCGRITCGRMAIMHTRDRRC